jgi:hypothetical protein
MACAFTTRSPHAPLEPGDEIAGKTRRYSLPDRAGRTRRTEVNGRAAYRIRDEGAKYGASFGAALAIAISYANNHSVFWAVIHGVFSWLYVIYFALVYG